MPQLNGKITERTAASKGLHKKYLWYYTVFAGFFALSTGVLATEPELADLSLDELLDIEVSSVSKKQQKLSDAPAAAYVITAEDIRRSGASNIPDLLRQVPGVQVAQIDGNKWAISVRGFNDRFANKLLVLVDGRSVYTPLYSGVYWSAQDIMLEDIARIEVIRGPGGTLWGANAVNGVINIITKHATDTRGFFVATQVGDHEQETSLRYGDSLGANLNQRTYIKYTESSRFEFPANAGESYDQWDSARGGFRAEWLVDTHNEVTVHGSAYNNHFGQTVTLTHNNPFSTDTTPNRGAERGVYGLVKWEHKKSNGASWNLQTYIDHYQRFEAPLIQTTDTLDIEAQNTLKLGEQHEITWGIGYRIMRDMLENSFTVSFDPASRSTKMYSFFAQEDYKIKDELHLYFGSKFEHNDYTGMEVQPSARLLWQIEPRRSMWVAVSRAVRTPSRSYTDITLNASAASAPSTLVTIQGNPEFHSETVIATELGFRTQLNQSLALDIATFYNRYSQLVSESTSSQMVLTASPPYFHLTNTLKNEVDADSYGLEILAKWRALPNWHLNTGHSFIWIDARSNATEDQSSQTNRLEGNTPEYQLTFQSMLDIKHNLEWNSIVMYVDKLSYVSSRNPVPISDYSRVDTNFLWRPYASLELIAGLQNALNNRHLEFGAQDVKSSELARVLYVKATWRI